MKIKKLIDQLSKMMNVVGEDAEVPVLRYGIGENDYIIPSFGVVADLEDQDGNKFKCALIGSEGGEELTKKGIPHYKWNCRKDKISND